METEMNRHQTNPELILVVDDEIQMQKMMLSMLEDSGFSAISASGGEEALNILQKDDVSVVISDITMPNMDGIALTERIKRTTCCDVILTTGFRRDFSYEKAIEKGASDFIEKPFECKELVMRLMRVLKERRLRNELKQRLHQSYRVLNGVVHALSLSIEARDPYTAGHQKRVSDLAGSIAEKMGLAQDRVTGIRMAGEIHDLGKIAVPAEILSKPRKLSEMEFSLIKTHPEVGYNILSGIEFPWPIAETVFQHHERLDGSGYPRGLAGPDILLEARIMSVADVVEAIASHRPYRPALGMAVAAEEIQKYRGISYDPEVVDACLEIILEQNLTFREAC
jgi:response regulator RpfG family c-di-GMP phosphodiesterase